MNQFFEDLKAAGVVISNEVDAHEYLNTVNDLTSGLMALARQGRGMGVTFSADPRGLNGPVVVEAAHRAGFSKTQADEFFANTNIQF